MAEKIKIGEKEIKFYFGHRKPNLTNENEIAVKIPKRARVDLLPIPSNTKKINALLQNTSVTVFKFRGKPEKSKSFLGLDIIDSDQATVIDLSKPYRSDLGELLIHAEKDWGWEITPTAFASVGLYTHGYLTFIKNIGKAVKRLPNYLRKSHKN
jgi:hypothetical protein